MVADSAAKPITVLKTAASSPRLVGEVARADTRRAFYLQGGLLRLATVSWGA